MLVGAACVCTVDNSSFARDGPKPGQKVYHACTGRLGRVSSGQQHVMNAGQLAVDGLWQCLCPAFRPATLARSYRQVGAATRPRAQCLVASRTRRGAASQARIEAAQFHHGQSYKLFESNDPRRLPGRPKGVTTPRMRAVQGRRERPHLDQEHTPFLYELLRTAASKGETKEVDRIVEILVQDRLEEPNLRLYGSLILVNVHPFHGSVGRVNALLEEMAEEGLVMDVGLCHDVLKVLYRLACGARVFGR